MSDASNIRTGEKLSQKVVPLRKTGIKTSSISNIRNAFKMKLKPGFKAEYKKRHDEIWPELSQVLMSAGILDYSIYLDEETNTLFAFQKLSPNNTADDLENNPIVRKWWAFMADIMDYNDDQSPVTVTLKEMFHMQ